MKFVVDAGSVSGLHFVDSEISISGGGGKDVGDLVCNPGQIGYAFSQRRAIVVWLDVVVVIVLCVACIVVVVVVAE